MLKFLLFIILGQEWKEGQHFVIKKIGLWWGTYSFPDTLLCCLFWDM